VRAQISSRERSGLVGQLDRNVEPVEGIQQRQRRLLLFGTHARKCFGSDDGHTPELIFPLCCPLEKTDRGRMASQDIDQDTSVQQKLQELRE